MTNELTVPRTMQELVEDQAAWIKGDIRNGMININPPKDWVKELPKIVTGQEGILYLPIDKHEYLLKRYFPKHKIKVKKYKQLFNAISVHVRVKIYDEVFKIWLTYDGLGAISVQTEKGCSPADLAKIKNGAVMQGLPAAESFAIKDACEKIGFVFGSNLNRKDTMVFNLEKNTVDAFIPEEKKTELQGIESDLKNIEDQMQLDFYFSALTLKQKADKDILKLVNERKKQFSNEAA